MERSLWCRSNFSCSSRTCQHTSYVKCATWRNRRNGTVRKVISAWRAAAWSAGTKVQLAWRKWAAGEERRLSWGGCSLQRSQSLVHSHLHEGQANPGFICVSTMTDNSTGLLVPSPLPAAREGWRWEGFAACSQTGWAAHLQWALNLAPILRSRTKACKHGLKPPAGRALINAFAEAGY